jgi:hypothetical protein
MNRDVADDGLINWNWNNGLMGIIGSRRDDRDRDRSRSRDRRPRDDDRERRVSTFRSYTRNEDLDDHGPVRSCLPRQIGLATID